MMKKTEVLIKPPKISPVFSVCVAGHRQQRLQKNWYSFGDESIRENNLKSCIGEVLQMLQRSAKEAFESVDEIYESVPPRFKMITGQAYGAEMMATQLAKEHGYEVEHLIATKPNITLDENEYGVVMEMEIEKGQEFSNQDFKLRDSIALGFSDIVVAVLDESESSQIKSGTAVMVEQALKQRKPVVLLHLVKESDTPQIMITNPMRLTDTWVVEATTLGCNKELIYAVFQKYDSLVQATATLQNWIESILLPFRPALDENNEENRLLCRISKQKSVSAYVWHQILWNSKKFHTKEVEKPLGVIEWAKGSVLWLKVMLNPPFKSQSLQIYECLNTEVRAFTWYENTLNSAHQFFSNLAKLEFRRALGAFKKQKEVNRYKSDVKPSTEENLQNPIKEPDFEKVFNWSDAQARVFSKRYKDDTWVIYYAAAFAVFCAVAGAIHLWPAPKEGIPFIWVFFEFILLHFIVRKVLKARFSDYHGRWMNFRFIAEQIRYLRLGFPLLVLPKSFSTPIWESSDGKMKLISAETWILQRVLIAQGLPKDADEQNLYRLTAHNSEVLHYLKDVLNEHKEYYYRSYHNLHKDHIYLHRLAFGLFTLTFFAVTVHFFYNLKWILIFTAFFPAWGAAIHGILSQNEVVRVSSMASQSWQELTTLLNAFAMHERVIFDKERDDIADGWAQTMELRKLVQGATKILSDENQYWRSLFRHNHPELPA